MMNLDPRAASGHGELSPRTALGEGAAVSAEVEVSPVKRKAFLQSLQDKAKVAKKHELEVAAAKAEAKAKAFAKKEEARQLKEARAAAKGTAKGKAKGKAKTNAKAKAQAGAEAKGQPPLKKSRQ